MKKVFFILVFAGLAAVVFHSCRKEANSLGTNSNESTLENDYTVWNSIMDFKGKINASDRSSEFITPDSALWYLEALFNVEQTTDTNFNYLDFDTSFYTLIPDGDGLVNINDIAVVYDEMLSVLETQLQSKNSDYKYLLVGDLSVNNQNRNTTFEMTLLSGFGIGPLNCYDPFYNIDDWFYGNNLGRLDGFDLWYSDAGYELEKRFNNPKNCFFKGGGYWVSIVQKEADSLEYPEFKYQEYSATIPWINDTLMRHYLSKGHSEIIYKYEADGGERPAGKNFKICDVWTNNPNPSSTLYFHSYTLWYGYQIDSPH